VIAYAGVLFSILPRLSLWLDEIRDLMGVRSDGLAAVIEYAARQTAAGVPLGYIAQYLVVQTFGLSALTGRLSSAVCSVAACLGLALLGKRLKIRHPFFPLMIFATFPLQLRYAMEARPYSQALCLSIWCTVAFFALLGRPGLTRAAVYALSIAAGLYSQPYSVFVPFAHACWILSARGIAQRRRVLWLGFTAMLIAAIAFLPWVIYASEHWQRTVLAEGDRFIFSWKSPLMILKELVGAGYVGTLLTLTAAAVGLFSAKLDSGQKLFWMLYLAAPVVCAIAADAIFSYFLAIRQMIFVLAPLALLSSLGIDNLRTTGSRFRGLLFAALLAVNVSAGVRFFQRPREDWQPAAQRLSAEVARGACIVFVPSHTASIYAYFQPGLDSHSCDLERAGAVSRIAAAVSQYATPLEHADAAQRLAPDFVKIDEQPGEPRVEVYRRR